MSRALRAAVRAALLSTVVAVTLPRPMVQALQINLNFVAGATNSNDPGNTHLRSIFTAAADRWGEWIEDNYAMTVNVSYYKNDAAGNGPCGNGTQTACAGVVSNNGGYRTAVGNIHVFADRNWYYDATPYYDEEFNFTQTLYNQLTTADKSAGFGGASPQSLLEIGYRGANNGSDPNVAGAYDLLGTAFHEFGHLLGLTNHLPSGELETRDGDYDVAPAFINAAEMSIKAAPSPTYEHLASEFPLMSNIGTGTGIRRLPSAADIFAAASVGRWSQINLERIDYLSTANSTWTTGVNWEGYRAPGSGDFVAVRHGGTARINGGASVVVGEVLVDNNSTVSVTDGLLLTDVLRITSTGNLSLTGGEVRVRNNRFEDNGGGIAIAGTSTPTFSLRDGAFGATSGIVVGGFSNPSPGVFIPAPGNLRVESSAAMHVNGNVLVGGVGPFAGHGNVTVDNALLNVLGAITLAPQPSAQNSELNIRNNGRVLTNGLNALTPTSRVSITGGLLVTKSLVLPVPGILQQTGGEVRIVGGTYNRYDERLSGTGNPLLRITEGSVASSIGLALGGFNQPIPGLFLPESGELRVESGSSLTTTGNVVLGGVGPIVGAGIAKVDNASWHVSGAISLAPGPSASLSQLTVAGASNLTATTIQALTPYSRIDVLGGNVTTENLILPAPGILSHTGGTVEVDGGVYANPSARISGFGSPLLRLSNGAVGATGDVLLGGFLQVNPGLFLPESGELRVESSSTLNTTGNVLFGAAGPLSGPGRAVLDDGVWNVSGDVVFAATPTQGLSELTIRNNSQLTANAVHAFQPASRIHLIDGGLIAQNLLVPAAQLDFTGGTLNVDFFMGPLIQNGGRVMIGYSPGEMQISGSYFQNAGVLEIELAEAVLAGAEYDLLSVSGAAALAGELEVSLLGEFTPTPGDRFTFLSAAGGVTGVFSTVTLPELSSDLDWNLVYEPTKVILEVLDALTADFDFDGDVDAADLNGVPDGWQARFGKDLNGASFLDWQRQLGSGVGPAATATTAPEPAALGLIGTTLLTLIAGMRRRRCDGARRDSSTTETT